MAVNRNRVRVDSLTIEGPLRLLTASTYGDGCVLATLGDPDAWPYGLEISMHFDTFADLKRLADDLRRAAGEVEIPAEPCAPAEAVE